MTEVVELSARKIRKNKYVAKLEAALNEYQNILLIKVDNVGSSQMQSVRIALRGKAIIIMGKNTIMRKVLRDKMEANPKLEALLPYVRGNMGFVFCGDQCDLNDIRKVVVENQVPAGAKTGVLAPIDVILPPGPTGLDPGQTSFFQAMNIGTKISRGAIEILASVNLIKEGEKVSASAVALLTKLGIKPFFYGIVVTDVYEDGTIYSADILDITDDILTSKFFNGVNKIAAIGLEVGYPTLATMPHSFSNAFKKLVAVCLETDYMFEEAKIFKEMLDNPDAFKSAGGGGGGGGGAAAAAPEPEPEEEEEEDADMGFSLFD